MCTDELDFGGHLHRAELITANVLHSQHFGDICGPDRPTETSGVDNLLRELRRNVLFQAVQGIGVWLDKPLLGTKNYRFDGTGAGI